jgi:hypothetical protein
VKPVDTAAALLGCLVAQLSTVACGPDMTARQACYAQHELAAARAAVERCPGGGEQWERCEHRAAILAELKEKYRSCP